MEYAVVSVAAAPMRRKPNHKKEMVNQLLFGEAVAVTREKGRFWVKVKGLHDGYEGWLTRNLITPVDEHAAKVACTYATTSLLETARVNEMAVHIPFGSSLHGFADGGGKFGDVTYSFSGNYIERFQQQASPELLTELSSPWLNVPYMWGGRTPLGVDCSGFVQVISKVMGLDLPRDAWQQAQEGKTIKKIRDSATGDLAFFDDKDEIVHVGILLNREQILHASGKVRIDRIDKKGIVNSETEQRTHRLELIKRVW